MILNYNRLRSDLEQAMTKVLEDYRKERERYTNVTW